MKDKKTHRLTIRLNDSEYGAIRVISENLGISKSDALRRLIGKNE
jgi:hypothetical protein